MRVLSGRNPVLTDCSIINKMQAIEEPKALAPAAVDETTAGELHLNEDGEVEIPREQIIGTASALFGDKGTSD